MNVLVVTWIYPTPEDPASGTFVHSQVAALRQAGVAVDVLVIRGRPRKLAYLKAVVELHAHLARRPIELVHAHYGFVGMVGRMQWRVPLVVTYHGDDILGTIGHAGKSLGWSKLVAASSRALSRVADAVIVQSDQMASRLGHRANVHVVPHEVDLLRFRPMDRDQARLSLGLDLRKTYLLFAANPRIPVKRFPLARAVADQLAARDPHVELLVVFKEPQERLVLYMNASDALVFPSYQEGSPNIIKQAMACNLPIVATDVGDVRSVIGTTERCAISEPTVASFTRHLEFILRTRERTQGRRNVLHLDSPLVARRVLRVYEQALRRQHPVLAGEQPINAEI